MLSLPGRALRSRWTHRAVFAGMLGALAVAFVNVVVVLRVEHRVSTRIAALPRAQVAIVPGSFVNGRGELDGMLADRVRQAVALFDAGKVDRILVSGDHGHLGYDETDTMRAAVLKAGVPARDVFTDYAGFDTWATMDRARRVFGVRSAIVVTQAFHVARAVDLGRAAGLEIHGLSLGGGYGAQGRRSRMREVLARVKGVEEATLRPGVLLGPLHPITGDGRSSWGPRDPLAPTPRV